MFLLEEAEQRRPLRVGDLRHAIVGIAALEVHPQDRVGGGRSAEAGDFVLQAAPFQHLQHLGDPLAVQRFHDARLDIRGEPFVDQKSLHVALVTRLPDHECASSCATSDTSDLSPAMIVGVANVSRGFSIPPNGNDGGKTSRS